MLSTRRKGDSTPTHHLLTVHDDSPHHHFTFDNEKKQQIPPFVKMEKKIHLGVNESKQIILLVNHNEENGRNRQLSFRDNHQINHSHFSNYKITMKQGGYNDPGIHVVPSPKMKDQTIPLSSSDIARNEHSLISNSLNHQQSS